MGTGSGWLLTFIHIHQLLYLFIQDSRFCFLPPIHHCFHEDSVSPSRLFSLSMKCFKSSPFVPPPTFNSTIHLCDSLIHAFKLIHAVPPVNVVILVTGRILIFSKETLDDLF